MLLSKILNSTTIIFGKKCYRNEVYDPKAGKYGETYDGIRSKIIFRNALFVKINPALFSFAQSL